MEMHKDQFSTTAMCRVFGVSKSGYYAWVRRPESQRSLDDDKLGNEIERVHKESKQTYGSPRIHAELRSNGIRCGRKRVARLMRDRDLSPKSAKKFKVTTDSGHKLPVAENLLDQKFEQQDCNQTWAADITYVWTGQGWLYLAVVLDLFSRRVVGWSMQRTMTRDLVLSALKMAIGSRRPGSNLLHHSDRGSQYASGDYQQMLGRFGITCSMSRKGNCWDNAPVESFFATLKRELVHHKYYHTRDEARADIFEYIESWYNRKRLHSSLGYMSPCDYETKLTQQSSMCA